MASSGQSRVARRLQRRVVAVIAGLATLAGCVTPPKPPVMVPKPPVFTLSAAHFEELSGWRDSDLRKSLEAFRRSCIAIQEKAADSPLGGAGYAGQVSDWGDACREAASIEDDSPEAVRGFFELAFVPYRISDRDSQGLFTGYYEPELRGSRVRQGPYQTPLYGVPPDLVSIDRAVLRDTATGMGHGMMADGMIGGGLMDGMVMDAMMRFVPYPTRAEIERDGLPSPPLFYVDDPIDAFFLQIQGSGRIALDDGSVVRAAYAGQNGHPYTAIGAVLLQRGELTREELSAQSIRAWLKAHPDQAQQLMDTNESYVFFSEQPIGDPALGALGAQGVPLTAEASLAVDRSVHALGVPVWLEASAPDPDPDNPDRPFNALLVMQDTGGAIRGVVRGDVYWGYGESAQAVAGRMKHPGRMTVLLPSAVAARLGAHAEYPAPR